MMMVKSKAKNWSTKTVRQARTRLNIYEDEEVEEEEDFAIKVRKAHILRDLLLLFNYT